MYIKRTNALVAAMAAAGFSLWLDVTPAHAAMLQSGDILQFDPGVTGGANGFVTGGSYFAMDNNGNLVHSASERTALSMGTKGIIIGEIQPSVGGHGGAVTGTEGGTVDDAWGFFSSTGIHRTTSAITGSTTAGLNFSGWAVSWNNVGNIPMGGGVQDCGTSTDGICGTGVNDAAGTISNGSGVAAFTWSGVYGEGYTLDYTATVPRGDPSNFGGVFYGLHLIGTVEAAPPVVPVPAAVWLFGSGLLGLVGVARRKRKA
jgi:hypothetical protein